MVTDQEILERLRSGRARIARGWCQRASARSYTGDACASDSPVAARWCMLGAIEPWGEYEHIMGKGPLVAAKLPGIEVARRLFTEIMGRPALEASKITGGLVFNMHIGNFIAAWNDNASRGRSDALAVFDRAIEHMEAVVAEHSVSEAEMEELSLVA